MPSQLTEELIQALDEEIDTLKNPRGRSRGGNRVPALLQETNQNLYMNADGTPHIEAIETLRRTFAEALYEMIKKVNRS